MSKRTKFLEGGRIHNYVKDPIEAVYNNNLMIDQAIAQAAMETDGLKMLGEGIIGLGTQLPGAIKGYKNRAKTGMSMKLDGPNHEQGGIPLNIKGEEIEAEGGEVLKMTPEEATIFSKRFGRKDDKGNWLSFADLEVKRQKDSNRDMKKAKDAVGKNTFKRKETSRLLEEESDKNIMDMMFHAFNNNAQRPMAATGWEEDMSSNPTSLYDKLIGLNPKFSDPAFESKAADYFGFKKYNPEVSRQKLYDAVVSRDAKDADTSRAAYKNISSLKQSIPALKVTAKGPVIPEKIDLFKIPDPIQQPSDTKSGYLQDFDQQNTIGNIFGIFGNALKAYGDRKATMAEIATDQPNINPYERFGEDALETNAQAMNFVAQNRDRALKNSQLEAYTAQKRGRGISPNISRAMDIAITNSKNIANSKIEDLYAQQMLQLMGQKSQLENYQDIYTMQGKEKQHLANIADKSARNMALKQSDINIGNFVESIGDYLNRGKEMDVTQKLINSMSRYSDINVFTGELKGKPKDIKAYKELIASNGQWRQIINTETNKPAQTIQEAWSIVDKQTRKG